jgi:hypothetical protein
MPEEALVVAAGCPTCEEIKSNGACTDNKCFDVTRPEGNKIANEANVKFVPQKVCKTKDGKWRKCGNTQKIIRKYSKKN